MNNIEVQNKQQTQTEVKHYVQQVRHLTDSAFVLKLNRNNLKFRAGQYIMLGIKGDYNTREYSIYNGERDNYFEVLVKEVHDGYLTKKLKSLKPGDEIDFDGPLGAFVLTDEDIQNHKFYFIASGTGISPFRSFVKSYPDLDYTLLHGIRFGNESYDKTDYPAERYISCVSRDSTGNFQGRITDYLKNHQLDTSRLVYLCGNSNMILDSIEILKAQGFTREQIHAEIYF
jgi:ferredoxin/flavodoxin---NADP+ reductase